LQTPPAITDLGDRLGDFHNTAAILCNLDLVITCDSAPAHLAGALGLPVWVALSYLADWRWLLARDDSPWYPTMRLYRQTRTGAWQAVFERIAADLAALQA
jgi:ADP-heptose:LPS heptosyltransferase